ncbi:hypothetical protein ACP70R_047179 [Stipagrostis hirtigluma subsp. patula]
MAARQTTTITFATLLFSIALVLFQVADADSKIDKSGKGEYSRLGRLSSSLGRYSSSLVGEACKNMSSDILSRKVHFDEGPCVTVLHSDKRTVLAKDHGDLVVIALDLLEQHSNEVAEKIMSILSGLTVRNSTKTAFQLCAADYGAMSRMLPVCRSIFLDIKPLGKKVTMDDAYPALGCMDKVGDAGRACSLELSNHWEHDKTEEFFDVIRHISLVWGLMELATGHRDDYSQW